MTVVQHLGDTQRLATALALCNDANLGENGQAEGEPTEAALVNFAAAEGLPKPQLAAAAPRVDEAPFDSGREDDVHHPHRRERLYPVYQGRPGRGAEALHPVLGRRQGAAHDRGKAAENLAENKRMADQALRVLAAAQPGLWDEACFQ